MIEKEFIPYEESLEIKKLGYNEPCFAQYKKYDVGEATLDIGFSKNEIIMQFHKLSKFCSALTYSQAFRWFREKYNLHYPIQIQGNLWFFEKWSLNGFKTYEEAELACLKELIEIIKNK